MSGIKDTIAKVLALAGSPNEHEARAALIKARELMAKYKLREEDITQPDTLSVVNRLTEISCTKMTNTWAVQLSAIIAEHYCCKAYRTHQYGGKKVIIGLVGLEDDLEVCEKVFKYAFDCVISRIKKNNALHKGKHNGSTFRQMGNAYGNGFCIGLRDAYRDQDKEHQDYALALVTPQPVIDAMSEMGSASSYGAVDCGGWRLKFARQGYQDGITFDPSDKLPEKTQA